MKFKSTWILVAVFGALGAYLYFVDQPAELASREAKEREGLVFAGFDPAQVKEIRLEGKQGTIRVTRAGNGQWATAEPAPDVADEGRIKGFLDDLKALKAEKEVAEAGAPLQPFGLDAPELRVTTAGQGVTLSIGAQTPAGDARYVRSGDGPIRVAKNYALMGLMIAPDDLRSRDLIRGFSWSALQTVTVTTAGATSLKLSRTGGKWRLEAPTAAEADPDAAEGIAEKLHWAKIVSFRPETPSDAEARLAKGVSVALSAEGSAPPAVVRFSEVDGEVWGQTLGRTAVFTVDRALLDAVRQRPEELRRKKPILTKTWSAEKLSITGPGASAAYEKSEGAWRKQGVTVRGAEGDALRDLLQYYEDQKANQVIETPGADAAYGLDAPKVKINLSDSQQGEQALEIGQKGPRVYARSVKTGPVYAVSLEYLGKALAVLRASSSQAAPPGGSTAARP